MLKKRALWQPCAAASRSASSHTTTGELPPSSRVTGLTVCEASVEVRVGGGSVEAGEKQRRSPQPCCRLCRTSTALPISQIGTGLEHTPAGALAEMPRLPFNSRTTPYKTQALAHLAMTPLLTEVKAPDQTAQQLGHTPSQIATNRLTGHDALAHRG